MGLGKPIDFDPPELFLDKVPSPFYVRVGATLSGTAKDDIGVTKVVLRDANKKDENGNPLELFTAKLGDGTRERKWEIFLDFSDWTCESGHKNSYKEGIDPVENKDRLYLCSTVGCETKHRKPETIMAEVVAFDKMGNSGDQSIAAVTLIVDVRPPIVEDMWIDRTSIRRADLEDYKGLKALEETDANGERNANSNKYQNGVFRIQGKVSEEETRVEIISLNIYDIERGLNTPLLELPRDSVSSTFSPRWTINETNIIAAGEREWPGYKDEYYAGKRLYFRVAIVAVDRSNNENDPFFTTEEEGSFVMWEKADIPKGILDPLVGTVVTKGGTLPVEFFDDDQLNSAYAGLLTKQQWDGETEIASGVKITGETDNDKLEFLRNRLLDEKAKVYNWKFDRYNLSGDSEEIKELLDKKKLDERLVYLQTGNQDADYGAFVLFTITLDTKLDPHPSNYSGDLLTYKTREALRAWYIDVVDENAPVIVLDTQYRSALDPFPNPFPSPEENTFPGLSDGERFTITGYTLRENGKMGEVGNNGVVRFRMAWIPSRIAGGADDYIQTVQYALSDKYYPNNITADKISYTLNEGTKDEIKVTRSHNGIQYWDFDFSDYPNIPIDYKSNVHEAIPADSVNAFRRQQFQREFNILGKLVSNPNNPATDPNWKDFHSYDSEGNYTLENYTKLFILYAEDNMGHQVFRQMRLLGNNTPPDLAVYDITGKVQNQDMPINIPNVSNFIVGGVVKDEYYDDLKVYNNTNDLYTLIKGAAAGDIEELRTIPFQAYPRDTILKYWIAAERSGDIAVESITMTDITYEGQERVLGKNPMHPTDRAMVFAERYPDETQRVFLFEATDTLKNVARIQRTIAVTNTAMLESITTMTQNGTYGIGKEIILQANFTGLIKVDHSSGKPLLNIHYPLTNGEDHLQQIEAEPVTGSAMSLQFKFTVPSSLTISCNNDPSNPCPHKGHGGATLIAFGKLETLFDPLIGGFGNSADETNRPIKLNGAVITDALREGQAAFVPGYTVGTSTMHTWTTSKGSLQNPTGQAAHEKDIKLDAIRPVIDIASVGGKTAWINNTGTQTSEYYFKSGETLTITLTSNDKSIKSSSIEPLLQYYIRLNPEGSPQGTLQGPYHATSTPASTFTYTRPSGSKSLIFSLPISDTAHDGEIVDISLVTATGHGAIEDDVGNTVQSANVSNLFPTGTRIFVKKQAPAAPAATLGGTALQTAGPNFNYAPVLVISGSTSTLNYWEDTIQYSTNGGLSWNSYVTAPPITTPGIGGGSHDVRVRYVDRAGNNGAERSRSIVVNLNFPRLLGVSVTQGNGTYKIGDRLDFEMSFADTVKYTNEDDVTIRLQDRTSSGTEDGTTSNSIVLRATGGSGTSTITFAWTGSTGINPFIDKDMLSGLRITAINISGLTDDYNTQGPSSGITYATETPWQISMPAYNDDIVYTVPYTLSSVIVSTIRPVITTYLPENAAGRTGNVTTSVSSDNKTITLTFNKPVQKGNGTITIRPHGNYAIPAVFENEGYYVGITSTGQIALDTQGFEYTYTTSAADSTDTVRGVVGKTWVAGFSDIFNNVGSADQMTLIGTNSMAAPTLSTTTGLSVGPYMKTTHGLKRGAGFNGNYRNATTPSMTLTSGYYSPGVNAPGPRGTDFMIPDISTKWVLRYSIEDIFGAGNTTAENTVVTNIRGVLNNAKFRWQEIAVTHQTNVTVSGSTVTINLPEPLLPGLQWTLFFEDGTFTDVAGNTADGFAKDTYWFWSSGVQKPVIRVDRKSYDARTSSQVNTGAQITPGYTAAGHAGSITDYNKIAYRIVSETPNSRIFYSTVLGSASTVNGTNAGTSFTIGSATGAWSGDVNTIALTDITDGTTNKWEGPKTNGKTTGSWVRPNLIYRNATSGTATTVETYDVMDEAVTTQRAIAGGFFGLRSYNKDATVTNLNITDANLSSTNTTGRVTDEIDFTAANALQASKNYVIANARVDHTNTTYTTATYTSQKGYEGVFRTVLMMNQSVLSPTGSSDTSTNPPAVNGTTRQSGLPTIAGFPLKDNASGTDSRFMKVMYWNGNKQWLWITSEIVSQIFVQMEGRGVGIDGSFGSRGDSRDWTTMGYGDLTYSLGLE